MFEELPSARERGPEGVTGDLLVVLEPSSGALRYVNAEAARAFALGNADVSRIFARDLIPELADTAPRTFETRIRVEGTERRATVCVEFLHAAPGSAAGVTVASIRYPAALPAQLALVPRSETAAPPEGAQRLERLESLWRLVVRSGFSGSDRNRAILREAVRGMRLESVSLGRVESDDLVVVIGVPEDVAEARVPVSRSLAHGALRRSGTFAVLDSRLDPEFAPLAGDVRCFLSAAFHVGDETWVLTFSSTQARAQPFEAEDWRYVENVIEALTRDIERHASDELVQRLAYSDALTSLPNRTAVLNRLDEAIAEAVALDCRTAVLFLDIDGFKAVNDTVGHRGGDIVLTEIASRLRGTLRREEYIGRLGGDEFAIVMPQIADRGEIESIAQRIGGVLTFPFSVEEYRFPLSASIGVAIFPDDAGNRDDLLASADAAMYAAKEDGGSRVRFRHMPPELTEAPFAVAGTGLGEELRDVGYILCYQPIVELATGHVVAAEALIRQIHPKYGLLAPERGFSIARDEVGRRALDRWVLREAATQARAWNQEERPIQVDVNLAAFDTRDLDTLLADEALSPGVRSLRIEIAAEQFADVAQAARLAHFIEHGASRGITFALDGFDGGLTTLMLERLPIDAIKLDRSLVERVASNRTVRAVVEGTVIIARTLAWSVTAKGVETLAQQDALVALGCDAVQGFFVAHPMTAVDFSAWLRERRFAGRPA
jgi:diguanylate cyclase (GGDEF)-like protein